MTLHPYPERHIETRSIVVWLTLCTSSYAVGDARPKVGARRIGWKLGMGRRERIGDHIAVGHLTSDTALPVGGAVARAALEAGDLHVDAEICVELGADVDPCGDVDSARAAVVRLWPALEIVDLTPQPGEPESIVATNIFHRAFAFGAASIPLESPHEVTDDPKL